MTVEEIRQQALELAEKEFKKFEPVALYNLKSASFQIIILMEPVAMVTMMWAVKSWMKCSLTYSKESVPSCALISYPVPMH